jgi:hypothetical protein
VNGYPKIKVDLLDLELLVRAFENCCKEMDALGEAYPQIRVAKPYPYERAIVQRLSDAVAEVW